MTDWKDMSKVSPQEIDTQGKSLAEEVVKIGVKTSQIRNLYGEILKIRIRRDKIAMGRITMEDIQRQLIFLKPKLAYATGRQQKLAGLCGTLVKAIDGVLQSENKPLALDNFCMLMESVVAYHTYFGEDKER